jgi:hypothetical protein
MHVLRSWVQIPPGPFLSVVQLRYWIEFILDYWRTNSAAMPPSYRKKFFDGEMEFSTIRLYISQRAFLSYSV